VASVRDIALQLEVPAGRVLAAFLHRGEMRTLASEVSDDEVQWLKGLAARREFPEPGAYVRGSRSADDE
jgi:hypothetical protein